MIQQLLALTLGGGWLVKRGTTSANEVALTFDDGPMSGPTERVLEVLAGSGHKATFFVIGNRVPKHTELLSHMIAAGHEIGNHSWSHPEDFGHLTRIQLERQIEDTDQVIREVTGITPRFFRPPFGHLSARLLIVLRHMSRLPVALWSAVPGGDRAIFEEDGDSIRADVVQRKFRRGDIILMHDPNASTVDSLPAVLDRLDQQRLASVGLTQMLDPSY